MSWKGFIEELACELQPSATQAAGPANVTLTVTHMPEGKHFRVEGTSVLPGFSFVVRLPGPVCALGRGAGKGLEGRVSGPQLSRHRPPP